MTRQLVLVHGRAQQQKDATALKAEWLDALAEGLARNNLSLPIPEADVRFPFYGDTLHEMVGGKPAADAAAVIVRGTSADDDEQQFTRAVMEEIRTQAGITVAQLSTIAGQDVIERGPLNWEWTQAVLAAIDRFVPLGSGASIALFTHDVYQYLRNSGVRQTIDDGVATALTPGVETVVVGHSLGSVVAYNLLRLQGRLRGWTVPLFVTVGSPLAVTAIRQRLKDFAPTRCPDCVARWFNAFDERDVVALYPLDPDAFPLDPSVPEIINKRDVRNETTNRHGIGGYLNDKDVAKHIYDALVA